jgi:hypothetical protein
MKLMFFRISARASLALAAALGVLSSACTDQLPTARAVPPPDGEPVRQEVACTVTVADATLVCGDGPQGGASHNILLGGQGTYVQLESSNPRYDSATSTFTVDVSVQNLLSQPIGTHDGTTMTGLKVFFAELPTATEGTGEVTVRNPDGVGGFTGMDQPYHAYAQILQPRGTSAPKAWEFTVPATVQRFRFAVYVHTRSPAEMAALRWSVVAGQAVPVSFDAVWGATARDVFAVGGPWIHAFDGKVWVPVAHAGANLWDMWGTSRYDVWTAGDSGKIVHSDGAGWKVRRAGTPEHQISGIWSGGADVYTVGRWRETVNGDVDGLLLRSRDAGATWEETRFPGAGKRYLRDVFRAGASVYAVGYEDPAVVGASPRAGVLLRSTDGGETWVDSVFTGPTALSFFAVLADGPDDVFIAGEKVSSTGTRQAIILHTTDGGATWSPATLPAGAGLAQSLWRIPGGKLYAATSGELLEFDGTTWSEFNQGPCIAYGAGWMSIWGSSAANVFMIGSGISVRYNNGCMSEISTGVGSAQLHRAITADVDYVLAVGRTEVHGTGGVVFNRGAIQFSLFGQSWASPTSFPAPDSSVFEDVWMVDRYFAVVPGWRQTAAGGSRGVLLRSMGPSTWQDVTPAAAATDAKWSAVWGTGRTDTYVFGTRVVGSSRSIVILRSTDQGATWSETAIPYTGRGVVPEVTDAWGSSAGAIHVSGYARTPSASWPGSESESFTLRYDGTQWTLTTAADGRELTGVWSQGSTVLMSGYRVDPAASRYVGVVRRSDDGGLTWAETELAAPDGDGRLNGIWGTAPNSVYAVGSRGVIHHFNGERWEVALGGLRRDLYGVAGTSEFNVHAAGDGMVIRGVR